MGGGRGVGCQTTSDILAKEALLKEKVSWKKLRCAVSQIPVQFAVATAAGYERTAGCALERKVVGLSRVAKEGRRFTAADTPTLLGLSSFLPFQRSTSY